jgi:hypothetical protein
MAWLHNSVRASQKDLTPSWELSMVSGTLRGQCEFREELFSSLPGNLPDEVEKEMQG